MTSQFNHLLNAIAKVARGPSAAAHCGDTEKQIGLELSAWNRRRRVDHFFLFSPQNASA